LFARLRQYRIIDPVPLLRAITAPTLLMWGARDQMVPLSNMDDYKQALADVRTATYSDMGHVPMEEGPDKSLSDLRAFLSKGPGSKSWVAN
jgi:pimeloyl-ACP methyl ester carboxylesterase